tara:strand:+ start:2192 stop:2386 length:195 start_codon:yes stop_codon:yes gene_type:complete
MKDVETVITVNLLVVMTMPVDVERQLEVISGLLDSLELETLIGAETIKILMKAKQNEHIPPKST